MKMYTSKDWSIRHKYRDTHQVFKRKGTEVYLPNLEDNESVVYGDGKIYHYLLIKNERFQHTTGRRNY